ncbi:alpha/beta fold hydrolase [Frigidibacter sp. ROC022]|uniref:alpha/beta fold hydrolase n=1 Tax=Frigidibacter sp. ROC022 TaxID=2971796 RepID=UPI00215B14CC|nr:alpha/beta hydrolase [Frigidibacter sp. ROC022]
MRNAAPFLADLSEGPEGGYARWVTSSDGVRLRVAIWPKSDAKGTILLFPGRTEYVEKYGRAAVEFADRGYAVATIDWRGQGLSERLIDDPMTGHVFDFKDYQIDVAALREAVRDAEMPEATFLVAHSMGGCIGLRALTEGLPVKAAAFSAPMWGIGMSTPLKPVAWAVSWAWPKLGRGENYAPGTDATSYSATAPFEGNVLTSDPEMYAYMQAQTAALPGLALGGPSLQWLYQALTETRALRGLERPDLPAVAQVGTNEKVVDMHAVEEFMETWKNGAFTKIHGASHEIMMEQRPIREGFFDSAASLFNRAA